MTDAAARIENGPRSASISAAIAEFATGPAPAAASDSALHILRLSLLDWFAVASAGRDEPVSCIVRDMAAIEGGAGEACVVGADVRLPARAAALANGATSHALDYDDTHFGYIGHPSVAVLPAALALAEKTGASGPAFLAAALAGVETACRVGIRLGRAHYDHGFHQTATSGAFGAAMAASRLIGLDADRSAHALGIAATRASGLKSQFGTMGKPYNAGIAAANGVEAALLAAAGFVSRPDGIECAQGFAATHAGAGGDPAAALEGLGRIYVFETVQHKFHACCHGLHAALEALGAARTAHALAPGDVARVEIATHPSWLKVCDIAAPSTGLEAKFSYRLAAAMALCGRDTAALETFSEEACAEPVLLAVRDRVRVTADEGLADTAARVRVKLASGQAIEAGHDLVQPLAAGEREARVRAKAAVLIGEGPAGEVWRRIGVLEDAGGAPDWPGLFAAARG